MKSGENPVVRFHKHSHVLKMFPVLCCRKKCRVHVHRHLGGQQKILRMVSHLGVGEGLWNRPCNHPPMLKGSQANAVMKPSIAKCATPSMVMSSSSVGATLKPFMPDTPLDDVWKCALRFHTTKLLLLAWQEDVQKYENKKRNNELTQSLHAWGLTPTNV